MELIVTRRFCNADCTIGELTIDGQFQCYTLEDQVRADDAPKVFGQTAIPYGKYDLVITWSPHFQRDLPLVVDVPGFSGIRIHPGNTAADTEGCLLLGLGHSNGAITDSRLAFEAAFAKIQSASNKGETITITYVEGQ
jgi:hypothetical protein